MKKLIYMVLLGIVVAVMAACSNDNNDTWEAYAQWRQDNITWLAEQEALPGDQADGKFYTRISPPWDPDAYVLMHWFNDRDSTLRNLRPLFTSTVSTRYIGRLYNDAAFDSSYLAVNGLFTTRVCDVVAGWQIALQTMHVGDSVQIIIPSAYGYGGSIQGSIPPYSALKFNMKLVDIPYYEID